MSRTTRRALLLLTALALLLRSAHFVAIAGSPFPLLQLEVPGGDMAAHWAWSEQILAGDWLGRSTYHQFPEWMRAIAPIETWHRWWGGEKIFHREPLYPYFLALARGILGRGALLGVLGLQLALGALQPLVLFLLARRLFDTRAGLLAAAFGAIHGPFVYFESALLRDWVPPLLDPLLLVAILRARDREKAGSWILAGVLFGLSILIRSSLVLFLPLALGWIAWMGRDQLARTARAASFFLLGLALGFAPLAARNLAVGAPILAMTNRAPEAIVESNAADSIPIGMPIPESMPGILERAGGSARIAAVETAKQYEGRWGSLLRLQVLKLWGAFDPREHADNLDYEYGRWISPAIRWAPGFAMAGLFGVAGILLFLRRGGGHALVVLYVLSVLGGQLVTVIVGRYRLGLTAMLIVMGAGYAVWCWDHLRPKVTREAILAVSPL